jgi:hypothetical protein
MGLFGSSDPVKEHEKEVKKRMFSLLTVVDPADHRRPPLPPLHSYIPLCTPSAPHTEQKEEDKALKHHEKEIKKLEKEEEKAEKKEHKIEKVSIHLLCV